MWDKAPHIYFFDSSVMISPLGGQKMKLLNENEKGLEKASIFPKKLIAILLALVILSPMAFAQGAVQIRAGNMDTDNETPEPTLFRERIQERVENFSEFEEQTRERIQERTENFSELKNQIIERVQERREFTKEQVLQAREKYQDAKEKYEQAKERYQEAKQNIIRTRTVLSKCRDGETEECVQAENQIKVHSKQFLEDTADRILNMLKQLRAKIEANEDLSEEEAAQMLADLDAKIAAIEEARESAENLKENSTKEDIKEAAQTIKNTWQDTKGIAKRNAGRLVNDKIGGIVVQIEQVRDKLDRIIERLQEQGYDIQGLEAIYADFEDELGKARENYEKAKEIYNQDIEPNLVDEQMKQAYEYMRQAKQHIQNAHQMLRNLVINIKLASNGQRLLETPAEELGETEDIE